MKPSSSMYFCFRLNQEASQFMIMLRIGFNLKTLVLLLLFIGLSEI